MLRQGAKALLGLGILGLGAWTAVQTYASSSGVPAVLNGKVSVLRAPYDGYVALGKAGQGSSVRAGQELGTLRLMARSGNSSDNSETIVRTQERIAAIEPRIATLQSRIGELIKKSDDYRAVKIKQLEAQVAEANENVEAARSREQAAAVLLNRQQSLNKKGLALDSTVESSEFSGLAAEIDRKNAEGRATSLKAELSAARTGTFLIDGFNDSTYSRQLADQLTLKVDDLTSELQQQQNLLAALMGRAGDPPRSADRQAAVSLSSPVQGIVWSSVSNGQYVVAGEEIARVVDCSALFLNTAIAQRGYASIKKGAPATFQSDGDQDSWAGTVIWNGAPDLELDKRLNAAVASQVPSGTVQNIVVALKSEGGLEQQCPVGKAGKVSFETGTSDEHTVANYLNPLAKDFGAKLKQLAEDMTRTARNVWNDMRKLAV